MGFLLDTNVLCESIRPRPSAKVGAWIAAHNDSALFLSVLSVGEVCYGIERLTPGHKRTQLEEWLAATLASLSGRILPFDVRCARAWATLRVHYPNAGLVDAEIAATALANDLCVVTRNAADFAFAGLSVVNPWED